MQSAPAVARSPPGLAARWWQLLSRPTGRRDCTTSFCAMWGRETSLVRKLQSRRSRSRVRRRASQLGGGGFCRGRLCEGTESSKYRPNRLIGGLRSEGIEVRLLPLSSRVRRRAERRETSLLQTCSNCWKGQACSRRALLPQEEALLQKPQLVELGGSRPRQVQRSSGSHLRPEGGQLCRPRNQDGALLQKPCFVSTMQATSANAGQGGGTRSLSSNGGSGCSS